MSGLLRPSVILGLGVSAFALVLILVWVPLDTTTSITLRVRRQYVIGDALAPTLAGVFLLIGGILLLLFERHPSTEDRVGAPRIRFVLCVTGILAISFLLMRFAGPAAVWLANSLTGGELVYRNLRATAPWMYIGYFLGCAFAVTGIGALTERRVRPRHLIVGVLAAVALIALYDLPFDDLLLPPNGDV